MLYTDYEKKICDIIKNPDESAIVMKEILDNIKQDLEVNSSLTEQVKTQEGRIRTLQDTNMNLFLRLQGNPTPDNEDKVKSSEEQLQEFYNKLKGEN